MKLGVINYGMGNLGSVITAIKNLGFQADMCVSPLDLNDMDKIILPGVGSFFDAMNELERKNWVPAINEHVSIKERPLLGICLGMQLLASVGNEGGKVVGLDLIPGEVKHLTDLGCQERVPHIGWNEIQLKKESVIFNGIFSGHDFYFVHSYAFMPSDAQHISATVSYSNDVVASVENENVFGTQFHPEKSSKAGLRILQNFLAL
tara:strand:+ start:865 stop:1479 length:615 start_codon:yes stop_codon:yes gene_type:complete